jgi:hypothetical protein
MARSRDRSGAPPFYEADGVVFGTDVSETHPNQPGRRGEAEEGELRESGSTKETNVADEAYGFKSGRKK